MFGIAISSSTEKRLLQIAVATACMVPLTAGFSGVLRGAGLVGGGNIDMDSHFRYLSGLLLGLGLGFFSAIPGIERQGARVRLLTLIVVIGGTGRLLGLFLAGMPGPSMLGALVMELVVTPSLCLWQYHLARRFKLS